MSVHRFSTVATLARAAADQIAMVANHATTCHIALSGGQTPKHLFRLLVDRGRSFLPWDRVELWWVDERCVAPDHPDSNYGAAYAALIAPLGLDAAKIHRMEGDRDPNAAAADYERALTGALGTPPVFDLVFLGMGVDGHIASLFPGSNGLRETQRFVVANRVDSSLTHGATTRLTLTYPAINAAKRIRFLVAGADKAETLAAVLAGPHGAYPAQNVSGTDVAWFVDDAAAANLGDNR